MWLWAAYAVSTFGTWLAFDAFPLIAILVLHAGPAAVSALAATGLAVGAVVAVPLGPWVEYRPKRPVMIAMDLVRFGALLSVPLAFALDVLTFGQLVVVAVVVAVADIAFRAASGAYLKWLLPRDELLVATGRLEATGWNATAVRPADGRCAAGARRAGDDGRRQRRVVHALGRSAARDRGCRAGARARRRTAK